MLKQVLESVRLMLDQALESKDAVAREVYIRCAKDVVEILIPTMPVQGTIPLNTEVMEENTIQVPPKKNAPLGASDVAYEVQQENGRLKKILYPDGKEIEADMMVELNGVAYEYREALGKPFQSGRVL